MVTSAVDRGTTIRDKDDHLVSEFNALNDRLEKGLEDPESVRKKQDQITRELVEERERAHERYEKQSHLCEQISHAEMEVSDRLKDLRDAERSGDCDKLATAAARYDAACAKLRDLECEYRAA